jgi:hypothetical protein
MEVMSSKRSKNKSGQNRAQQPQQVAAPGSSRPNRREPPAITRTPEWEQRQAEAERGSSPNMLLGALIVVAIFLGLYYHALALHQMRELMDGLTMPDHHLLGYHADTVATLREAMNSKDRGQLNWTHKTAGTLFALFTALATAVTVGMKGPKSAWRWLLYLVAVAFAVVQIVQNVLVDNMLKSGGASLVPVGSVFTVLTWVLLALCIVIVVAALISAFVREFRRRWADPSLQKQGR